MKYLRRERVVAELAYILPTLLDAARVDDDIPDERVVKLERRYTTRHTASDAQLCKLMLDACDLARSMWSNAEQEDDLADLFALAGRLVQEQAWAEQRRREGLVQLELFKKRRGPQEDI